MDEQARTELSIWQELNAFTDELGAFVVNSENKWALALLAGFILGLLSRWLVLQLERRFHRGPEHRLLSMEFQDVVTHYDRNLELIRTIISEVQTAVIKGGKMPRLPSAMHFEKLKMPEDAAIFNEKTLRLIHGDYVESVLRTRIRVRNRNIEAERVIKYMSTPACEPATLLHYLKYLEKHHSDTRDKAQVAVNELTAWFKLFRRLAKRIQRGWSDLKKWIGRSGPPDEKPPREVIFEPCSQTPLSPQTPDLDHLHAPYPKQPLSDPDATRPSDEPVLGEIALKRLQEMEEKEEEQRKASGRKNSEEDETNS